MDRCEILCDDIAVQIFIVSNSGLVDALYGTKGDACLLIGLHVVIISDIYTIQALTLNHAK